MVKKKKLHAGKKIAMVTEILNGEGIKSAAKTAGLAINTHAFKSIEAQMIHALEKAGLTVGIISEKLVDGFNATTIDRQGEERIDYDTRLKYIRTALEVLGLNRALKVEVANTGPTTSMSSEEIKNLITSGTVEAMQKMLAERTIKDATDATIRE